jgi:hypothetical protein
LVSFKPKLLWSRDRVGVEAVFIGGGGGAISSKLERQEAPALKAGTGSDETETDLRLSQFPVAAAAFKLVSDCPLLSNFLTKSLTDELRCFRLARVPVLSNCSFLQSKI